MSVPERFKWFRINVLKMTQQELATTLDVAQSAVGNWETGRNQPAAAGLWEMTMKARILLRKEKKNLDGTSPLALSVQLGKGRKVVLGLGGLSAKPCDIDAKGFLKGRDQGARDMNLELQRHLSRANEILIKARLSATGDLDPEAFKAEWAADGGSQDFVSWSEKELARQFRVKLIGNRTRQVAAAALRKVRKFAPDGVLFGGVNQAFLEEFDAWHRQQLKLDYRAFDDGRSARIKALKSIRKFILAAKRAGAYNGKNPFADFKMPKPRHSVTYLSLKELNAIRDLYYAGSFVDELRPFLFACYTGLRFSDVHGLRQEHLVDGKIKKQVVKGAEQTPKMIDVPLTRHAVSLLDDGGLPLVRQTDQHINRTLKQVAKELSIDKRLTFHVARHTFATLFLEAGGSVEVLKELLGHCSLSITMIYVHIAGERKASQMEMMGRLFD